MEDSKWVAWRGCAIERKGGMTGDGMGLVWSRIAIDVVMVVVAHAFVFACGRNRIAGGTVERESSCSFGVQKSQPIIADHFRRACLLDMDPASCSPSLSILLLPRYGAIQDALLLICIYTMNTRAKTSRLA